MFDIDSSKCNGCGNCVSVCPEQTIVIHNSLAIINQIYVSNAVLAQRCVLQVLYRR